MNQQEMQSEAGVITAEATMQAAQEIALFAGLVRFIGVAESYGVPMMVQLQLADPGRTNSVTTTDVIIPVLAERARFLRTSIESKGIDCTNLLLEIETQLEASKQRGG